MAGLHSQFTYDAELELKAAGLVGSTAAGSIILDLGDGLVDGLLVLDVSAVEVASGDEKYDISLEASNVAAMDSGSQVVASKALGIATAPMDDTVSTAGRYVVPFRNEQNGTVLRYVRVHTTVAGTVATGINFSAFIAKR